MERNFVVIQHHNLKYIFVYNISLDNYYLKDVINHNNDLDIEDLHNGEFLLLNYRKNYEHDGRVSPKKDGVGFENYEDALLYAKLNE